jgi:simple sugar transport system substrate-binding protein
MFKKTYLIVVLTSLFLLSCLVGTTAIAEDKYKITIVVHGGIADPFWKIVEKGVEDIAARFPDIEVSYRGPELFSFEGFMAVLKEAVQEKPDALVCTLTFPEFMDELLRPAIAEGLPVIGINAADMRPKEEQIPVLTYIGEDSYLIGVTAAEETLKRFTPKRALFANHQSGSVNIDARGQGWIDAMKNNGIPAEQIDITGDDMGKAAQLLAAYLLNHPDTDAIFISNIPRAQTIISRLEADGYNIGEDIKFAQMDLDPVLLGYIENDKIMFTMDQQPYLQGYLGVMLAYLHVKYGVIPPPAPLSTGPGIITKENIAEILELSKQGIR